MLALALGLLGCGVAASGLRQLVEGTTKGLQQQTFQAIPVGGLRTAVEPDTVSSTNGNSRRRQREGQVIFENFVDRRPEGWSQMWALRYFHLHPTFVQCLNGLVV